MAVLTSNYPTSLDTTSTLGEVANRAKSTLAVALASSGETQISLANASGFPDSGALTIDNEIFYYSSKSGNVLTIESRSQQGTTGAAHLVGALVYLRLTKGHWEGIRSSIIALQTKLGVGASTPSTTGHILGINGSGQTVWGTPASFGISGGSVSDATYSSSWNADTTNAPSKNALYDRLQLLHNYVVIEDHASLSAALSYITTTYGTADVELRIGSTVNVSSDTLIPSNVYVSWSGSGLFNISAGVTLEIRAMINPGPRRLYTGAGKMRLTRNTEVWAAWWIGKVGDNNPNQYTTIDAVQWDGMISSGYGGLILRFTEGQFRTTTTLTLNKKIYSGGVWVNSGSNATGITVKGVGSFPDPYSSIEVEGNYFGTVIRGMTDGIPLFETESGIRNVFFEDICFYLQKTFTGQANFDITGTNTYNIEFNRCAFYGGDYGLRVKSDGTNDNMIINVICRGCTFIYNKLANFKSETSNTSYSFYNCTFNGYTKNDGTVNDSICLWFYYSGATKVVACTFNGVNINERAVHSLITELDPSTGLATIPNHGIPVGEAEPITIRNSQIERVTVVASSVTAGTARISIKYEDTVSTGPFVNGWQFATGVAHVASQPAILNIDFAVGAGDSANTIATNARAAINANVYAQQVVLAGGTGANIDLTLIGGDQLSLNDPYWNMSLTQTSGTGITTVSTSTAIAATTANLPTNYADKTVLYFLPVDTNTGYFYTSPSYFGVTGLRVKFPAAGSNNVLRTMYPRKVGTSYLADGRHSVPYAAIKIENSLYNLSIDNCQDEGFQYSMVTDTTYAAVRPVLVSNTTFQSPILFKSGVYYVSIGSIYHNRPFKDKYLMGVPAHVESYGDSVIVSSGNSLRGFGRTVYANHKMSEFVGGSQMRIESTKQVGHFIRHQMRINLPNSTPLTTPALDISRYQDDSSSSLLLRMGGRSNQVDSAQYYYDFTRVNDPVPANLFVPATQGYLEIKPHSQGIYGGVFVRGHLAKYGREYNAHNTALGNTGTVSVDCSLGSRFSCTPSGDITFNFSNVAPGQLVTLFVEANTTSKLITWGTGVYATGGRFFKTGTIAGYYQFEFWASSGGILLQIGTARLTTASYVSPNPEAAWGADTTTTITLSDGDRRTANSASRIDYTLPSSPVYGTCVSVKGTNTGGFRIYNGNASHLIRRSQGSGVGVDVTTTGTSGYIGSTDGWDAITLMYVGSNTWSPITMIGGFNFV